MDHIDPLGPEGIARSLDQAADANRAHRQRWIAMANRMPDGTTVKGWTRQTIAGDVFWLRGRRVTVDLALETGTAAVEAALLDLGL